MSNNKQRNSEKITSFSEISKAAMPASEAQPVGQSAKSGSRNGQQSAKSVVESTKFTAKVVAEEKAPERDYTSTMAFVEKLLPTTGSLMVEAIASKIKSLADSRDELVSLIEAAKEEGVSLNAKVSLAEETIKTISGMVLVGALRTNERLNKLNNDDLEEIALVEYSELWAQASADVLAQMKAIAAAKSRYAENKVIVLEAAKRIRFIDSEIAEWRAML